MSVRSTHLKLIGAAGAVALVGAVAAPALAAGEETADVTYSCDAGPVFGVQEPTASYAVDAPPATMTAGQTVKLPTTATFTLSAETTALATTGLGWSSFSGTVATTPTNSKVGQAIDIAKTAMGGTGETTVASASGKTVLRYTTSGSHSLQVGGITQVVLQGYDGSDQPTSTVSFPNPDAGFTPCQNEAGLTPLQNGSSQTATVSVNKDKSKTATTAKYLAAEHQVKGTAKVKGAQYGLAGTGKVTFILKKGTHKVGSTTGKLNKKGIASVTFKNIKKHGTYKLIAKFGGDKALKASSGTKKFSV